MFLLRFPEGMIPGVRNVPVGPADPDAKVSLLETVEDVTRRIILALRIFVHEWGHVELVAPTGEVVGSVAYDGRVFDPTARQLALFEMEMSLLFEGMDS